MQKKEFSSLLSPTAFYDQLYDLYSRDEDADEFVYMFNQEIEGKNYCFMEMIGERIIFLTPKNKDIIETQEETNIKLED